MCDECDTPRGQQASDRRQSRMGIRDRFIKTPVCCVPLSLDPFFHKFECFSGGLKPHKVLRLPAKSAFRHSGLEAPPGLHFGGVLGALGHPFCVFCCFLGCLNFVCFSRGPSRQRRAQEGPGLSEVCGFGVHKRALRILETRALEAKRQLRDKEA